METVVRARIVRIGNSQGVRLPKAFLQQSHLAGEVELALQDDQIVIRRARRARDGWAEQFREMAARGDDRLLDPEIVTTTTFDQEEWTW